MISLSETTHRCDKCSTRSVTDQAQVKGPLLLADWEPVLFLHFAVNPNVLAGLLPSGVELELHAGQAWISLVRVTMRRFRGATWYSPAHLLRAVGRQQFLNLRTYVRYQQEPGAFFFQGWLSRPSGVPLPSALFGFPYALASFQTEEGRSLNEPSGCVIEAKGVRLAYKITSGLSPDFNPCRAGSLAEFALERYTGFFERAGKLMAFRIRHPSWQANRTEVSIVEDSLIRSRCEWFKRAQFVQADYAAGFSGVWLGAPEEEIYDLGFRI